MTLTQLLYAVPLDTDEIMTIGYVKRKGMPLSMLGEKYVEILKTYNSNKEYL